VIFLISIAAWYINRMLKKEKHPVRYLTLQYVGTFKDLFKQSLHYAPEEHVAFIIYYYIHFYVTPQH